MSVHQFIRCSTDSSVFIIVWLTKYFRSNIISFKTKVCTTCSSSSSKFEFTNEKCFIPVQWKFYFELAHFGCFHLVILILRLVPISSFLNHRPVWIYNVSEVHQKSLILSFTCCKNASMFLSLSMNYLIFTWIVSHIYSAC
jgi:hypothetical protein